MEPNHIYSWEMETADGEVRRQYDKNGLEQTWKTLPVEKIIRVSFMPVLPLLPQHDVFINIDKGERFVKRFGRGFIRHGDGGIKLREYLNCCVTNNYRVWVFATALQRASHEDQPRRVFTRRRGA